MNGLGDVSQVTIEAWIDATLAASAAIVAHDSPVPVDVIRASPRAIYGEVPVRADWLPPVLDFSTKYIGLDKTPATALMWRA